MEGMKRLEEEEEEEEQKEEVVEKAERQEMYKTRTYSCCFSFTPVPTPAKPEMPSVPRGEPRR